MEGPATYHDIHVLCDKENISIPKMSSIIENLQEQNFFAARTSFIPTALRTNAKRTELVRIIKKLIGVPAFNSLT